MRTPVQLQPHVMVAFEMRLFVDYPTDWPVSGIVSHD